MDDKKKDKATEATVDGFDPIVGKDGVTEETLAELSNGKGDGDNE